MTWDKFFDSPMGIAVAPALISAFFSLVGVIISLVWSERKTQKGMEQALKIYESELSRKVYASSKRLDMEFEIFHNMSSHCGNILKSMQRLYPDRLSTLQNRSDYKLVIETLASDIENFGREINFSRTFIPAEIIGLYYKLLENAEAFYAKAMIHNGCWEDTKDDRARKADLKDVAYQARVSFEDNWKEAGTLVNKYLLTKE